MKIYRMETKKWHLKRLVFLIAGTFTFTSILLAMTLSPNFLYFTLLVGAMQIFFALTGYCPMAILLHKFGIND